MVVKEYWWAGKEMDAMRMPHWAKLNAGQRTDVFAWLRSRELALEERFTPHNEQSEIGARNS